MKTVQLFKLALSVFTVLLSMLYYWLPKSNRRCATSNSIGNTNPNDE